MYSFYNRFLTGSLGLVVYSITLTFHSAEADASFVLGIASAPGATPAGATLLGTTATVNNPDATGTFTFALSSPVTLAANTYYYILGTGVSGQGVYGIEAAITGGNTLGGGFVNSSDQGSYTISDNTTDWTLSDVFYTWGLIGQVSYWDLVAAGVGGSAPGSSSAAGTAGTVAWDSDYIYVCVATNTWKRVGIATW